MEIMFALSLTVYEIFTNKIKCQTFDLENEGEGQGGEKRDWRNSTGNFELHVGEFFSEILVPMQILTHTYTHTHTHTSAHTWKQSHQMTTGIICSALQICLQIQRIVKCILLAHGVLDDEKEYILQQTVLEISVSTMMSTNRR